MRRLALRSGAAALHLRLPSMVATAPCTVAAAVAPIAVPAVRLYGRGGSSKGEPRLSFAERVARRTPKSREQRLEAEDLRRDAEEYAATGFRDEAEGLAHRHLSKAREDVARLNNPVAALERIEVDAGAGVKRPLLQLATVTKPAAREIHVTPNQSQFTTSIVMRLSRVDRAMSVTKDGKLVKVSLPPVTRERREHTAAQVDHHRAEFVKAMKVVRRHGVNYIEGLGLTDDGLRNELVAGVSAEAQELEADNVAEFAALQDEALTPAEDDDEDV